MKIISVAPDSPALENVVGLWRQFRGTLGLFPRGAFDDAAAQGYILAALGADAECLGYLLFRTNRTHAVIVHLCVAKECRSEGVAAALFEELKTRTQHCNGVVLRCRRDYEANSFWPKLGFKPVSEKPGRSRDGKPLTLWFYDYQPLSLFSVTEDVVDQGRPMVVLDANVFYDLQDPPCSKTEESKPLQEDWLQSLVEICITDELLHEINRNQDEKERSRRFNFASGFRQITTDAVELRKIEDQLVAYFKGQLSDNDRSDIRHLAHSIGAGATHFVTRDDELLNRNDEIYNAFGLSVVRPCELIIGNHERLRAADYLPARFAGSMMPVQRVSGERQVAELVSLYQAFQQREQKSELQGKLRLALSAPERFKSVEIKDADGQAVALYVMDLGEEDTIRVPILRVRKTPFASALTRHIVWKVLNEAASEHRSWVIISDNYLPLDAEESLRELRFTSCSGEWVKSGPSIIGTSADIASALGDFSEASLSRLPLGDLSSVISAPEIRSSPKLAAEVELSLWPTKITDAALPAFIVPIKAHWASQLVDETLANQTLFGSQLHLALSVENVYYRSARPTILRAPARVLWYVSGKGSYSGSMSIRATSYIRDVRIGPAKELFQRYRRLGIYQWSEILKLAKGEPNREIMAFSFTHTELLPQPVEWRDLQRVLQEYGQKSQIQSPLAITSECYFELYRLGITANLRSNDRRRDLALREATLRPTNPRWKQNSRTAASAPED